MASDNDRQYQVRSDTTELKKRIQKTAGDANTFERMVRKGKSEYERPAKIANSKLKAQMDTLNIERKKSSNKKKP